MAYQEIDRSSPNDGQGDDARSWSGKTNENMKELYSRNFKLGDTMVHRRDYDTLIPSFAAYKAKDRVDGFVDPAETHFVDGIIRTVPFIWPDDIDDTDKFFKLTEKINANI